MTIHKLNITGIHCKSCKTLIEAEITQIAGVKNISVDHITGKTEIETEGKLDEIHDTIKKLGYDINYPKTDSCSKKGLCRIPFKLRMIVLFLTITGAGLFLIQKWELLKLMAKLNDKDIGYSLIFLIGLIAGFHCIGMCGGLVLAYSSNEHKNNESRNAKIKKHLQYNLGRLVSYTVIGGVLGGLGSFFGINPSFSGFVTIVASVFMILMGASIITKHKLLEKIKIKTPDFIAKLIYKNYNSQKPKGPLLIGLLTGFMPCGPLQAMQLYALVSGSFLVGATSMLVYSLGTIPLMFSFGSIVSMLSNSKTKKIMTFSGILVIILGVLMFNRGLVNFGSGISFTTPDNKQNQEKSPYEKEENVQIINMDVTYSGYTPNVIYIKKDIPVKWIIADKGITGCTNEIILYTENGVIKKKLNKKGVTIIEFTPTKTGDLKFSCWMKMVWGKFIVTDNN